MDSVSNLNKLLMANPSAPRWLPLREATRIMRRFVKQRFVHRKKYDYNDLWMKFSDQSSGSLHIQDLLPRVAEFIAAAMSVRQVAFWLHSTPESYRLVYSRSPASSAATATLRLAHSRTNDSTLFHVSRDGFRPDAKDWSAESLQTVRALNIQRLVLVENRGEVLALMGIGAPGQAVLLPEDDQFLLRVSDQLGHLILTHKLSEELLLSREWESFNRFASFILHDLKNLATLQSMTLENAKYLSHDAAFIKDAFATFSETTEKMINLIASLSVQRGHFSLKQQPLNILEVLTHTFDDLKVDQRNGVKVLTAFPPKDRLPIVSGDPELLQKAFTNLLLNAIQSLPKGKGAVEITVAQEAAGKITTSIRDSGCGIAPERLETLFRPFQTTKENGLGIGLCHTRSIIEVHGGRIRIESQLNAGTKVEVELPAL